MRLDFPASTQPEATQTQEPVIRLSDQGDSGRMTAKQAVIR